MKNIFLTFTLLICFYNFAQENIVSTENHLKTSQSWVRRTFASVNESNDDFSVYLQDEDSVYGYLFDVNYEKVGELKAKALRNKYKTFLGSTSTDKVHFTYFSNNKNTKFSLQSFDFENNLSETKEIDLNLDNEKFLQSFVNKNIFYILSIGKDQSVINIYVFNNEDFKRHVIDLSKITFLNWRKIKTSLYKILDREDVFAKIENGIPSSILNSFNSSKLYLNNKNIFITLDQQFAHTDIISIDLDDFSHTHDSITHNQQDIPNLKFKGSNSFLVDNKLFQTSIIEYEFVFSIKDIETKETLKELRFKNDDVLSFKNGELTLDKIEKKRTKKFLKRATNDIVGLNVFKRNNGYEIELGSYQIQADVNMSTVIFSNLVGSFVSVSGDLIFTPSQPSFGYSSYLYNASINSNTFSGVLNSDLEFNSDEFTENAFDKIKIFSEEKSKFIRAENVFIYKDNMFFCATIKDSKSFLIAKFDN